MIALAAASTVMVALGLAEMPYGFYMLLRTVLCLTGAVGWRAAWLREASTWLWIYGTATVLYNPILPLRLGEKDLWIVVNLATLVVYWIGALRFRGALAGAAGTD